MADLSTTPDTTARCTVEDASCVRTLPDGSRLTVFDNLSLSVAPGTVLCVRGRSGSGKTTLLGVIGGLLRPTSGRVYWGGQEIWSLSEAERAARRRDQLAVILQDGGLIEWLTAEENVALSLSNGAAKNGGRIREILEQVGLGGRRRNYPHELSMGERERVAIARALVRDPDIVLVDEPTAALDRNTSTAILDLLLRLARDQDAALIVASHDPNVFELADEQFELPD
ncbi:MAG TPA: ATP-binding cassette domain-containing protein [Gaiellaceae bacterium]|nr:ATP-binding cassette domain-containing protein [Gaiellaceae bacterium]